MTHWRALETLTCQQARAEFNLRQHRYETWSSWMRLEPQRAVWTKMASTPSLADQLCPIRDWHTQSCSAVDSILGIRCFVFQGEPLSSFETGCVQALMDHADNKSPAREPQNNHKLKQRNVLLSRATLAFFVETLRRLAVKNWLALTLSPSARQSQVLVSSRGDPSIA